MKTIYISIIATALMTFASILSGCSHLSSEAKEMVGCYFIPEVSQDDPLMELNANGSCVIRAVKPGVLTMSVPELGMCSMIHLLWSLIHRVLSQRVTQP